MNRLIIGCGYLGLRAANCWLSAGDHVVALSRAPSRLQELAQSSGIHGLQILEGDITAPKSLVGLPDSDTVLFAVGMDRTQYQNIFEVYVDGLANVLESIAGRTKHLIYISSTGVYGDSGTGNQEGGWVTEDSATKPTREGGQACLAAEMKLKSSLLGDSSTILRFAGIYGPGRIPFKNAVEEKNWRVLPAIGFLNLIHVDDGARIIQQISNLTPAGETFLVSDGEPVLRTVFYETLAELMNVGKIDWPQSGQSDEGSPNSLRERGSKRIVNEKLIAAIKYQFQFPNYRVGLEKEIFNGVG